MTNGLDTLPIARPPVRPTAQTARRPSRAAVARASLSRRRWGFAVAVLLMLATLPLHLLGLALVGIEVLSPSTDGPVLVGSVGLTQLLLLVAVATVGQLIGGGGSIWRRRFAFSCLNALVVVVAATIGWLLLL